MCKFGRVSEFSSPTRNAFMSSNGKKRKKKKTIVCVRIGRQKIGLLLKVLPVRRCRMNVLLFRFFNFNFFLFMDLSLLRYNVSASIVHRTNGMRKERTKRRENMVSGYMWLVGVGAYLCIFYLSIFRQFHCVSGSIYILLLACRWWRNSDSWFLEGKEQRKNRSRSHAHSSISHGPVMFVIGRIRFGASN